jgi:hypothetical protein
MANNQGNQSGNQSDQGKENNSGNLGTDRQTVRKGGQAKEGMDVGER